MRGIPGGFDGVLVTDRAWAAIDRRTLVSRHAPIRTECNRWAPLQVGNGTFAFNADITGLQTLVPFGSLSHWGWHEFPVPNGVDLSSYRGKAWEIHGRRVYLPDHDSQAPEASRWLVENPHRINLGRLGLLADGHAITEADLSNCRQHLDVWSGTLSSSFVYRGAPVHVTTCCHPRIDGVAVRIVSPLLRPGRLAVFVDFPYGDRRSFAPYVGDWTRPRHHRTACRADRQRALFRRTLDTTTYHVDLAWDGPAALHEPVTCDAARPLQILHAACGECDLTAKVRDSVRDDTLAIVMDERFAPADCTGPLSIDYLLGLERHSCVVAPGTECRIGDEAFRHRYVLDGTTSDRFEFVCAFAPDGAHGPLPSFVDTLEASARHWCEFWNSGGAVDLSASSDPRAAELERRIILSQYLMAVNEASALPAQESGLVNLGWNGKFHFEMYLWHAAHWAVWDRWPILRRSLDIYPRLLASARERAAGEGFRGARWPKCTGPSGRETPHEIHALLVWQQPHVFFFAELDYRAHPSSETLRWWRPILEQTAEFLVSYLAWDGESQRYVLGPPLHVVSENTDPRATRNPAFELAYWRFGLNVAQAWRERLGEERNGEWDDVLQHLASLPVASGCYVTHEGVEDMWERMTFEHPAIAGIYGLLPGDGIDMDTLRRTAARVFTEWQFDRMWGWDFPMLAMCAARLGLAEQAVDLLLHGSRRFQFDDAGLAMGGPFPYFPSNGALLYAVAMMCAGWQGCDDTSEAPGFPQRGWRVRWEGLQPAL